MLIVVLTILFWHLKVLMKRSLEPGESERTAHHGNASLLHLAAASHLFYNKGNDTCPPGNTINHLQVTNSEISLKTPSEWVSVPLLCLIL